MNSHFTWALYYVMALIVVLPGAFYLSRKVPVATKIIWGLIWVSVFLGVMIIYPYVLPLFQGPK